MPQLIAMVIVVVGAMIYMFQTFGGTGDKIEGIAQKSSIITEINNIKNGIQLALRAGDIDATPTTLKQLADLGYFADQMNEEIKNNTGTTAVALGADLNKNANTYSAISFGGENNPGLFLTMVVGDVDTKPGIRVEFTGSLKSNGGFLETQIADDLKAIASIDRSSLTGDHAGAFVDGEVKAAFRPAGVKDGKGVAGGIADGTASLTDGVFTIYFKDMPPTTLKKP